MPGSMSEYSCYLAHAGDTVNGQLEAQVEVPYLPVSQSCCAALQLNLCTGHVCIL